MSNKKRKRRGSISGIASKISSSVKKKLGSKNNTPVNSMDDDDTCDTVSSGMFDTSASSSSGDDVYDSQHVRLVDISTRDNERRPSFRKEHSLKMGTTALIRKLSKETSKKKNKKYTEKEVEELKQQLVKEKKKNKKKFNYLDLCCCSFRDTNDEEGGLYF